MLSDSTVGKFLESTGENPIFAQVDLYDTPLFYRDDFEVPYARAQVAVLNCSRDLADDNVYARMAVLDVDNIGTSYIYRQLSHGDYLTRDVTDLEGSILEPTKDLKNKYNDFIALHEQSPMWCMVVFMSQRNQIWNMSNRFQARNVNLIWKVRP